MCDDLDCPYGSDCIVGDDNLPHCVCPDCSDVSLDPVCGSDQRTYKSECNLMRVVCRYGRHISVVQKGRCDEGKVIGCGTPRMEGGREDQHKYRSEYHLMRIMCRYGRHISVVQTGRCDESKDSLSGAHGRGRLAYI